MRLPTVIRLTACILMLSLCAAMPAAAQNSTPTAGGSATGHTYVYREITSFVPPDNINSRGEEAPLISDDGQHIAYTIAPGTGDPATPNKTFVMNVDGSGVQQIDSYTPLCYCGTMIDISADGSRVVGSDAKQIRLSAGGSTAALLALDSNEIDALRISGDGSTIFFRVYRGTTITDGDPIASGIYRMNPDGSGLTQIVSSKQLEALTGVPADFVSSAAGTIDASTDGSHVIFGAFHDAKEGGVGQGLFAVDGDGSGLRELVGRVEFVKQAAISGDGSTVAYVIVDDNDDTVASVMSFDGGESREILKVSDGLDVANHGVPGTFDRIQLTTDGGLVQLGSSGLLVDTATGEWTSLGVASPTLTPGVAPLVNDGLYNLSMTAEGNRFAYMVGDAANVAQIATIDLDSAEATPEPALSDPSLDPDVIQANYVTTTTAAVTVSATGELVGVGVAVLRNGIIDHNVSWVQSLFDDGQHGDGAAGDGVFANNTLVADCCASNGVRTLRFYAQSQDAAGRRTAAALDYGTLTVEGAVPTATPSS